MTNLPQQQQLSPGQRLQAAMNHPMVAEQFKNALAENKDAFVASLIELYASDMTLSKCSPNQVALEALKAATLKLPINKGLGFAYIVPYKKQGQQIPQFQLGYKGMIQLAMRTGQYRFLNDGVVYEGELKGNSKLTGELDLTGEKISDTIIGYFAHLETLNGFQKTVFATVEDIRAHAERYSKSFSLETSPWQKNFDAMARKTMLRVLLSKYGVMSVEMARAITMDTEPDSDDSYFLEANGEVVDIKTGEVVDAEFDETHPKNEEPAEPASKQTPPSKTDTSEAGEPGPKPGRRGPSF